MNIVSIPTILAGGYEEDYQVQYNQTIRQLLGDTGWQPPNLTDADVLLLSDMGFVPILPRGTFWFNTDIGKMQLIVTSAISGIANAVVETIQSA